VTQVNRIIVASLAKLTQTKLSLAAMFVITRSSFIVLFITSVSVFADTLVVGSMYFDSEQTLKEVINLSAQHDNEGIAKLIQNGHISDLTREEKDIVVLKRLVLEIPQVVALIQVSVLVGVLALV
jgi:hypothetical protein